MIRLLLLFLPFSLVLGAAPRVDYDTLQGVLLIRQSCGSGTFDLRGVTPPPDSLKAVVRAGILTLDLRASRRPLSVDLEIQGGRVRVLVPETAPLRVAGNASALSALSGDTLFKGRDGLFTRTGQGPELFVRIESYAGAVRFTASDTAGSADSVLAAKDEHLLDVALLDSVSDRVRYNRVEGLYLGATFDSRRVDRRPFGVTALLGYAFSAKIPQYEAAAAYRGPFLFGTPADFALSWGRRVLPFDDDVRWFTVGENTLHTFLFGNDYLDYFKSEYVTFRGDWNPARNLTLFGRAGSAQYRGLAVNERFYLLGSDTNQARWNYGVHERKDRFLQAGARFNNATSLFPRQGLDCYARAEYSGGRINSDFTYRRLFADFRAYAAPARRTEVAFKALGGEVVTANDSTYRDIASQKFFHYGIGFFRGLGPRPWGPGYKNRMLSGALEIKHLGRLSPGLRFPFIDALPKSLLFIGFFDIGNVWNTEDFGHSNRTFNDILREVRMKRLYKTVGLGLALPNERLRLDLTRAHRYDWDPRFPWHDALWLRFSRPF